jgi:tetratricopeptide (TPR) repeat protein
MTTTLKKLIFLLAILSQALLVSSFIPSFRLRNAHFLRMTATENPPQKFTINTISSRFELVKSNGVQSLQGNKNTDIGTLLELRGEEFQKVKVVPQFDLKILQRTSGPVPRPYLPSLLLIANLVEKDLHADALYDLVEEAMRWYLDAGGRVKLLEVACPPIAAAALESMGFERSSSLDVDAVALRQATAPAGSVIYSCSPSKLKEHCAKRLKAEKGNKFNLNDIIGRLLHDMGEPKAATEFYTAALGIDPKSAATFRNLGSAYHAAGNMQLAFASYQQAVQLDEKGKRAQTCRAFDAAL